MFKVIFISSLLFLLNTKSQLCFLAPESTTYTYDELIEKTPTILLVKCTEEKRKNKSYVSYLKTNRGNFHVIEVINGEAPKKAHLIGHYKDYYDKDFNNHSDSVFWKANTGRTPVQPGECGPSHVYNPSSQYLIFLESQYNYKAAELIKNTDDKWYKYVKNKIKASK